MIPITATAAGVRFAVRVTPRAGRTGVSGERGGALAVRLAAAPVDGAANDALVTFLASLFHVPRRQVSIASGGKSRDKIVSISGLDRAQAEAALVAILPE